MNYATLPEGADNQIVRKYLIAFLEEKERIATEHSLVYALEQLSIIAEQYAYYHLDESLEKQLTEYLINVLDLDNCEIMDVVLFIVVNMSLNDVMKYLLDNKNGCTNAIIEMITESAEEMSIT